MREPPKGPIKWLRRRALPWAARLTALVGAAVLLVWGLGAVLTDESHWSQYVWWVPSWPVLVLAWISWGVSAALGALSTRLGGAFVRPFLLVACLVATVWVALVEWRLYRVVRVGGAGDPVRIVHWNLAQAPGRPDLAQAVLDLDPDIAVVANPRRDEHFEPLLTGLTRIGDSEDPARPTFARFGRFAVASTFPIVRSGEAPLHRLADTDREWVTWWDHGRIAFFEFDASARYPDLGRSLVVWVVDLPSDPRLWRMDVMREARRAIDMWAGPAKAPNAVGLWRPADAPGGFPAPDVVVGDFNAPRGSASLDLIVDGLTEAHSAAGFGPDASWQPQQSGWSFIPRLWHIDLTFVDPAWRVRGYDVHPGPVGGHALQAVDVERR